MRQKQAVVLKSADDLQARCWLKSRKELILVPSRDVYPGLHASNNLERDSVTRIEPAVQSVAF